MGQRLIGLPIAVGFRAARVGLRAAKLSLDVLGAVLGRRDGDSTPGFEPPATVPPRAEPEPPEPPVAAEADEPVSEEPELVAEFADPGAEDGAHAEFDVAEPWEGYARMTARAIEQRLTAATAEEVAVVRLYETTHKRRQSVLRATERRMNQQAAERRRPR